MGGGRLKPQVIIPIGPGHREVASRAIKSVLDANCTPLPIDDSEGLNGRSKARNHGVGLAESDWIFFLDADDIMLPSSLDALDALRNKYVGIWGPILEIKAPDPSVTKRPGQIERIKNYRKLLRHPFFLTIQMGHWVRREVALQYPFREDMDVVEDVSYYLDIWSNEICVKQRIPLFVNVRFQHSKGPRSRGGGEWSTISERLRKEALHYA